MNIDEQRNVILHNVPEAVYYTRQLAVASNSGLKILDERSPRHYQHWCENPDNDDDATAGLIFGKAFHCATLEPDKFATVYSVLPAEAPRDLRRYRNAKKPNADTLAAIDWWDNWEAANVGRIMLSAASYDQAAYMGESLRAYRMEFPGNVDLTGGELFDSCEKEVTLFWTDEETGIRCKARADLHNREFRLSGELKSVMDGSREAFARAIVRYRYHVQNAHYGDGYKTCGEPITSFPFFCVEKTAPYVVASWHVDAMAEERGYAIRRRSLLKLKRCLEEDRWPGHTTTLETLSLPAYAFYSAEDDA